MGPVFTDEEREICRSMQESAVADALDSDHPRAIALYLSPDAPIDAIVHDLRKYGRTKAFSLGDCHGIGITPYDAKSGRALLGYLDQIRSHIEDMEVNVHTVAESGTHPYKTLDGYLR